MTTTVVGSYVYTVLFADRSGGSGTKAGRPPWWRLTQALSAPYRPELHYMRGPGPKWREKHGSGAKQRES
jgi:hypothetical protein